MTVKLINIGRQKVNKTIQVDSEDKILKEARKYLISDEVSISLTKKNTYTIYAGFHPVGTAKVIA